MNKITLWIVMTIALASLAYAVTFEEGTIIEQDNVSITMMDDFVFDVIETNDIRIDLNASSDYRFKFTPSSENVDFDMYLLNDYYNFFTVNATSVNLSTNITINSSFLGAYYGNKYYNKSEYTQIAPSYTKWMNESTATIGSLVVYSNFSRGNYWLVNHADTGYYGIHLPQSCINSPRQVRLVSKVIWDLWAYSQPQCYNGSVWINVGQTINYTAGGFWDISGTSVFSDFSGNRSMSNSSSNYFINGSGLFGDIRDFGLGSPYLPALGAALYDQSLMYYQNNLTFNIENNKAPVFFDDIQYTYGHTTAYSNQSVLFNLNMSYLNPIMTNATAYLYLDGVNNGIASDSTLTNRHYFSKTITIADETQSYYWNISIPNPSTSATMWFTINNTITPTNFTLINCTSGNITLNMSIFNEDVPASSLNAALQVELSYWINNYATRKTLNYNATGTNEYYICLDPTNLTYYSDLYVRYTTNNGFTHRYYWFNQTLNSTQTDVPMYNFDRTNLSDLRLTLRNRSSYGYYTDVLSKLQRRYTSEGVWRTVQMDLTGDFGLAFFNVIEENTDYRLIFTNTDNCVLDTTQTVKFSCDNGLCERNVLLGECSVNATTSDIVTTSTYDNGTGIITINWENTLGENTAVTIEVIKDTFTGKTTICSESQTGSSGTATCNASVYTGEVYVTVYDTATGIAKYTEWIKLALQGLSSVLPSGDQAMFTFLTMVLFVFMGIALPEFAIFMVVVSLIFNYWLGLFGVISISFIIFAVTLGIIVGLAVRRR